MLLEKKLHIRLLKVVKQKGRTQILIVIRKDLVINLHQLQETHLDKHLLDLAILQHLEVEVHLLEVLEQEVHQAQDRVLQVEEDNI